MSNTIEELANIDDTLPNFYPLVNFERKKIKYVPGKHELEKGDLAEYLDTEDLIIKKGIVEEVQHSNPMRYPIYQINGNFHMYHRVWPKVDEKEDLISYKDQISKNTKEFISQLNSEVNKLNQSEQKNAYSNLPNLQDDEIDTGFLHDDSILGD